MIEFSTFNRPRAAYIPLKLFPVIVTLYKDNIEDLDINTEKVYDLRPVSFKWKSNGVSDFGFIAEEVQDILPELVVYNEDNTPEAVKYKQLSILMLEELKKLREEVKDLKEKL